MTITVASASASAISYRPRKNHVAPLPAKVGATPAASRMRSRHSAKRGSTTMAAASRSLIAARCAGTASSSQARYTAGVDTNNGGTIRVTTSGSLLPGSGATGSTTSPMPRTRARPPTIQNAMSAPTRDAATRSVKPAQRNTAAASAEPPPSPPPLGICLSILTPASRCANCNARATKLSALVGTPSANGPLTLMPVPCASICKVSHNAKVVISASMR